MALRPLAFGARFQQSGRTVRVQQKAGSSQRYVVEVEGRGRRSERREHNSLTRALGDFAASWRARLH
jgi:hypothetical protein